MPCQPRDGRRSGYVAYLFSWPRIHGVEQLLIISQALDEKRSAIRLMRTNCPRSTGFILGEGETCGGVIVVSGRLSTCTSTYHLFFEKHTTQASISQCLVTQFLSSSQCASPSEKDVGMRAAYDLPPHHPTLCHSSQRRLCSTFTPCAVTIGLMFSFDFVTLISPTILVHLHVFVPCQGDLIWRNPRSLWEFRITECRVETRNAHSTIPFASTLNFSSAIQSTGVAPWFLLSPFRLGRGCSRYSCTFITLLMQVYSCSELCR